MSNIQQIDTQSFDHAVLRASGPVLVDFYADWCGPCQAQLPVLESFAESSDVSVVKVNVDESPEVAASFGVRSIPTLALFQNGEFVEARVGTSTAAQLEELVAKH